MLILYINITQITSIKKLIWRDSLMNKTLVQHATVKNALFGVDVASTKTGEIIDRDAQRDAIIHAVAVTTGSPTATSIELKLQHSDTEVTGDFVDAVIQGQETALTIDAEGELHVNLEGFKRYIRVVANASFTGGTTPKATIVATAVLGNAEKLG